VAGVQPDTFGKGFLGNAVSLQFLQQFVEGDALQIFGQFGQRLNRRQGLGFNLAEGSRIIQESYSQGRTVMAVAVFTNVTTTSGSDSLLVGSD
jgi:hypothetical protein